MARVILTERLTDEPIHYEDVGRELEERGCSAGFGETWRGNIVDRSVSPQKEWEGYFTQYPGIDIVYVRGALL